MRSSPARTGGSYSSRETSRCRARGRRLPPTWWSRNISAGRSERRGARPASRQLIVRVVDTITGWGEKQGYFADAEARDVQRRTDASAGQPEGLFQQPGLFQRRYRAEAAVLGLLHPQGRRQHGVDTELVPQRRDDLQRRVRLGRESVGAALMPREAVGGGTASGPLSFMKAADASAGVIKSGGKTRRAAKMVVLNADHPDIKDFINCKVEEEKKAWALIDAGYDSLARRAGLRSVFFQNANNSVRATDEFMRAVVDDGKWRTRFVSSRRGGRDLPRPRAAAR